MRDKYFYILDFKKIERIRKDKKMPISTIAQRLGIPYNTLYNKLSNQKISIDFSTVIALCILLEIDNPFDVVIPYHERAWYYLGDNEYDKD